MPMADVNGIRINYQISGRGPLVVLVMGTGSPGRVWHLHQVPALVGAGFRVLTFDNRGIAPSDESAGGMVIDDLVADTAALIHLLREGDEKAVLIGTSMGARVVQELALSRPDVVSKAILLAGHARLDELQKTLSVGERAVYDAGIKLPPEYSAAIGAVLNLSPASLRDPVTARDWLDLLEFSTGPTPPGVRAQMDLDDAFDRRAAYAGIRVPLLSIGFADDRMIPAYLGREVAEAVPGARYVEIPDVGHWGYLEQPQKVNQEILRFLAAGA